MPEYLPHPDYIFILEFLVTDYCVTDNSESKCGDNADCVNKPDRFDCKCRLGFEGDPFSECKGIVP